MHASVIFGTILCLFFLFLISKIFYNLITNSHLLKYEFPEGWSKKITERYPIFSKLDDKSKNEVGKKTQIIVAQRKVHGLLELDVKIDLRLALAFEMSFLNQERRTARVYSSIDPISVLPWSSYQEHKNRSSFTIYWDEDTYTLYLETPANELLKGTYYLWLKVDKRFSHLSDEQLLTIHRELSESTWPISLEAGQRILNSKFSES
ncbi:hypothetical protein BIY24_11445 [Halobacteriovorax marinus]|uniref:Membrane protein n=1 Tax=Halobacteriovorax marinus (strain ATCC BAA-682 / DSM 15412 / SJ) TaxID=862908 RepID=E1X5B7_HALMS|nr:zinc-dependent peptidase [Halobacteriovorax marinus]ATH08542.1 hypothetical protein BIY24_11445 [Halobacteriovorax marinus]CBW27238.1 putative membrane protein [Halobacteriovorax marinus SJ]